MKLPKKTIDSLARVTTEAEPQTQSMLDSALAHARLGFGVFPLAPGRKGPLFSKKQGGRAANDGTTDEDQIRAWWTAHPNAGVGLSMMDDLIGFDLDFDKGLPEEVLDLFPPTRTHWSGRRNGNRHLIYRVEPGVVAQRNGWYPNIDLKAEKGAYLVGPPSRHEETGHPYTVGDENGGVIASIDESTLLSIADSLGVELPRPKGSPKLRVVGGSKSGKAESDDRKTLIYLLDHPGEGGRNNWLARVAGHYAKQYHGKKDLYDHHCRAAFDMVAAADFDWYEANKTIESIWSTEEEGHPERSAEVGDAGWLVGNGKTLEHWVKISQEEVVLLPFGNFDLIASGVAVDKDSHLTYWATLVVGDRKIDTTVPGELFGDDRALRKWLANYGARAIEHPGAQPYRIATGVRLQAYLDSQRPTRVDVTQALGIQETSQGEVFVTLDGVIDANGYRSKEEVGIVADRKLVERDIAPFHYGFADSRAKATSVLRQVMEFHHEEITAVFGAWWAACWLKPTIMEETSLFPIMGIEATSESGKTRGFFEMMIQMNGNSRGHTAPTVPVLRDYATANYNGIVWMDDKNEITQYEELLRASTTNGPVAKMGEDRNSVKSRNIIAPMSISGEGLGLEKEKALADRSVILHPTSPVGRKNTKGEPQWNDVMALQAEHPVSKLGLTVLAGWYAQLAMQWRDRVIAALRIHRSPGRVGDRNAVLLAGAQLLDTMLAGGDEWVEDGTTFARVTAWIEGRAPLEALTQHNALTRDVLPLALELNNHPTSPDDDLIIGYGKDAKVPAWIQVPKAGRQPTLDVPKIRFRLAMLANWYGKQAGGRESVISEDALRQQAQALGARQIKAKDQNRKTITAWELPDEYAQRVLDDINYTAD